MINCLSFVAKRSWDHKTGHSQGFYPRLSCRLRLSCTTSIIASFHLYRLNLCWCVLRAATAFFSPAHRPCALCNRASLWGCSQWAWPFRCHHGNGPSQRQTATSGGFHEMQSSSPIHTFTMQYPLPQQPPPHPIWGFGLFMLGSAILSCVDVPDFF